MAVRARPRPLFGTATRSPAQIGIRTWNLRWCDLIAALALLERMAPRAAVAARVYLRALPVDQVTHVIVGSRFTFVASAPPAVKGAASRLASLGPVGPPLTAGPLRLDGNEGPLMRTASERPTRGPPGIPPVRIAGRCQLPRIGL